MVKGNKKIEKQANEYFNKISNLINTKQDLINLKIDGILIGDFIYDSFLKENSVPTIEMSDSKIKNYILECFNIYFFGKIILKKIKLRQ